MKQFIVKIPGAISRRGKSSEGKNLEGIVANPSRHRSCAAENSVFAVESLPVSSCLPCIPVGNKICREIVDRQGKNIATSKGPAFATFLLLSCNLDFLNHAILIYACTSLGVNGGEEGQGAMAEDGSLALDRRATNTPNKNGVGS